MHFTQLAIIGPTASGKSELAIKIAQKIDAYILSIDSLSVYKEIDIVSAKPSKEELNAVKHFGIDLLYPNEYFSVDMFIGLYKKVLYECEVHKKNLIIVGGTSFYLKSLIEGLSQLPVIDIQTQQIVKEQLQDVNAAYNLLFELDSEYMRKITPNDAYRIEKALLIYEASKLTPTQWFAQNPPSPIIKDLAIYNIDVDRDLLRKRIQSRTNKMYAMGLVDEVCFLEQKYTRSPHAMGAIGIVEVLDYLDGKTQKDEMLSLISTHTAQLAKRQQTFNRTQFHNVKSAKLEELEPLILQNYKL